MYMMEFLLWIFKMILSILVFRTDVQCLKNVVLTLEPPIVEKSHNCTLRCTYDLEGLPLYTVKWYRGIKEFYRYTPDEKPSTKVFPTQGITVDENQSNSTQVVLQDIEFNLSGNFTCEVTADNAFSTAQDIQVLQVVQLPDEPPKISVSTEPLDYGDILSAKCMSSSSKPPAALKFLLNNRTVARTDPLFLIQKAQELSWSDLSLNITLTEEYFTTGRLILRCEAQIDRIYHKYAELRLNTAKDPVPERVSAVDSAFFVSSTTALNLIVISFITLFLN